MEKTKGIVMAGVQGRVVLVTGAGSAGGIGYAIARAMVAGGARVCVTSTTARIHDRAGELGGFGHVADLTDPAQVVGCLPPSVRLSARLRC